MRTITIAAWAVLTQALCALEFNPRGNAVGFDMHRRVHPVAEIRKRGDPTGVVDTTYYPGLYYVNITLGTPPQNMAIQIDTGSADFWMPASNACGQGCLLGSYAPHQSSTWEVTEPGMFNTSYAGQDYARGDLGTDVLGMGSFTLDNFTFGVGSDVGGPGPRVGTMGLSYYVLEQGVAFSNETGYPTVVDALYSAGLIDARAYSLYLNDFHSPGSLLFGGIDTAKFEGDLAILDLQVSVDHQVVEDFSVSLTGLSFTAGGQVNQVNLGPTPIAALLDSGTAELYLPNEQVMALYQGLGVVYYPGSLAIIPCNADVAGMMLNFTLGSTNGVNIGIPLSQFIQPFDASSQLPKINGDQGCEFAVLPTGNGETGSGRAILGDSFLRGTYVVFDLDNQQVAVAPAILNATGSQILPIAAAEQAGNGAAGTASANTGTVQASQETASGPVTNSIPSATLVASQTSLSVPAGSYTGAAAIPTGTDYVTLTATFKGLPSGGINNPSPTHNAAPRLLQPTNLMHVWVSGPALLLVFLVGSVWVVL